MSPLSSRCKPGGPGLAIEHARQLNARRNSERRACNTSREINSPRGRTRGHFRVIAHVLGLFVVVIPAEGQFINLFSLRERSLARFPGERKLRNIFLRERAKYVYFPRLGKYCAVACIRASEAASRGLADGNVAHARARLRVAMSVTFSACPEIDVGRTICVRYACGATCVCTIDVPRSRRSAVRGNRRKPSARYACTCCLSSPGIHHVQICGINR